jgi:hypothetical protein
MRFSQTALRAAGVAACFVLLAAIGAGQSPPSSTPPTIPKNATALEGQPTIRIDVSREGATRRQLDRAEAATQPLKISIVNGRYYWASRDNQPLTVTTSGAFTYLSSREPGHYVRFTKIDDRLEYVEHVDRDFRSVTFWGELRIVLQK